MHMGDARDGNAGGDDETIACKLTGVESSIKHLYVLLTIYDTDDIFYFNSV